MKISQEECLRYYQGGVKTLSAASEDGRRVRFPANVIKKFINHHGISGRFQLNYDPEGKLLDIIKL